MKIPKSVIAVAIPRKINVYRDWNGIYKIMMPGGKWDDPHTVILQQSTTGAIACIRRFPLVGQPPVTFGGK